MFSALTLINSCQIEIISIFQMFLCFSCDGVHYDSLKSFQSLICHFNTQCVIWMLNMSFQYSMCNLNAKYVISIFYMFFVVLFRRHAVPLRHSSRAAQQHDQHLDRESGAHRGSRLGAFHRKISHHISHQILSITSHTSM